MMRHAIRPVICAAVLLALLTACDEQSAGQAKAAYSHRVTCESVASSQPALASFLQQLHKAVAAKDVAFIQDIIDEHIKFSFGGDEGKSNFLQNWGLDADPQNSEFWATIQTMLSLGGYAEKDETDAVTAVIYPCTFRPLPADNWLMQANPQTSGFDYVVVIKDKAPLTDGKGNLIRLLEQGETLRTIGKGPGDVTTHDGHNGFVAINDVRSPIDYRMFLQQQDGQWKITLFIQGD